MSDALTELLERTIRSLDAAGIADEALAVVKTSRFAPTKLVRAGRAWRLGMILLDRDGTLYEIGELTRAVEPPRGFANKSPDAEVRREWRRAALRGKFSHGEAVNFRYRPIDVATATGAVRVIDGTPMVQWNASGDLRPLEGYLAERLALLLDG